MTPLLLILRPKGDNMEVKQKNILQNILYYSLIAVIVALSVFYMIALAPNDVMMYAKVVYYIWIAGLLLVLMLDILATIMCRGKFCTGLLFLLVPA